MMDERRNFDHWWDYSNPEHTEIRFRKHLASLVENVDPRYWAELLTQIARSLSLQHRFAEAHETLDGIDNTDEAVQVRIALERGRTWRTGGEIDLAADCFHQAWTLASALGSDGLAVDAAHMMALVSEEDQRVLWNDRALKLAQTSPNPNARRWRASLLNNLAWDAHNQGQYAEALELFEQALEIRIAESEKTRIDIAQWSVARCLRSLGRVEEALGLQLQLLERNSEDGFVFEEIGECLLATDRESEAAAYFGRAFQILRHDRNIVRDEPDRLARLERLGSKH